MPVQAGRQYTRESTNAQLFDDHYGEAAVVSCSVFYCMSVDQADLLFSPYTILPPQQGHPLSIEARSGDDRQVCPLHSLKAYRVHDLFP